MRFGGFSAHCVVQVAGPPDNRMEWRRYGATLPPFHDHRPRWSHRQARAVDRTTPLLSGFAAETTTHRQPASTDSQIDVMDRCALGGHMTSRNKAFSDWVDYRFEGPRRNVVIAVCLRPEARWGESQRVPIRASDPQKTASRSHMRRSEAKHLRY